MCRTIPLFNHSESACIPVKVTFLIIQMSILTEDTDLAGDIMQTLMEDLNVEVRAKATCTKGKVKERVKYGNRLKGANKLLTCKPFWLLVKEGAFHREVDLSLLHWFMDTFDHQLLLSLILILVLCVHVCLFPARSREWNVVSPRFFRRHKEILLASCTKCF